MKLKQINENLIMQQLRGALKSSNFFNRPTLRQQPIYQPESGHDSGARTAGFSSMTSGMPSKPRHQKFLGLERRMGIRL
jgi:hypothetical protein